MYKIVKMFDTFYKMHYYEVQRRQFLAYVTISRFLTFEEAEKFIIDNETKYCVTSSKLVIEGTKL